MAIADAGALAAVTATALSAAPRYIPEVLLVEDNPDDVELTLEAAREAGVGTDGVHVARDGVEAMAYLHREGPFAGVPQPRLVLLDLNLPRKDGREVLEEMKSDPALCSIPVLILSTSKTREDVRLAYMLHANGYITKPVDFSAWPALIRSIWDFWFNVVELPNGAVPLGT